ncbi:hypothetical protein RHOSPDRAFT_36735 [Rhodotorula sp. JG-1b]|nr:hypothetical protein RHOSPDRAFT_36735 [Rhodotorula sp. JG-1b]
MSEDERGLDGWHVCGLNGLPLNREQLFYSKDPVVKLSDTEYINIQNASRLGWTPDMWSAHKELLKFGCAEYAYMLAQALHVLVAHTGGAGSHMTNFKAKVPETIEQFSLKQVFPATLQWYKLSATQRN